jgi:hypothetical protein
MKNRFQPWIVRASVPLALFAVVLSQCGSPPRRADASMAKGGGGAVGSPAAIAAWQTIDAVLQHPRCLNCHPAGDAPLQGDRGTIGASCRCRLNPRRGLHARGRFITSRCSRPSRLSRRVQGTQRASRPAAERERWTDKQND